MKFDILIQKISFLTKLFCSYSLEEIALTRSGDKADSCNVGIVARHPKLYPYIKEALTTESVAEYFKHVFPADSNPLELVNR